MKILLSMEVLVTGGWGYISIDIAVIFRIKIQIRAPRSSKILLFRIRGKWTMDLLDVLV